MSMNSSFTMFATNIFSFDQEACYPYIFLRLTAYEKSMGLVGEAYSKQGVSSDHRAADALPSLASVTVRVQIH